MACFSYSCPCHPGRSDAQSMLCSAYLCPPSAGYHESLLKSRGDPHQIAASSSGWDPHVLSCQAACASQDMRSHKPAQDLVGVAAQQQSSLALLALLHCRLLLLLLLLVMLQTHGCRCCKTLWEAFATLAQSMVWIFWECASLQSSSVKMTGCGESEVFTGLYQYAVYRLAYDLARRTCQCLPQSVLRCGPMHAPCFAAIPSESSLGLA